MEHPQKSHRSLAEGCSDPQGAVLSLIYDSSPSACWGKSLYHDEKWAGWSRISPLAASGPPAYLSSTVGAACERHREESPEVWFASTHSVLLFRIYRMRCSSSEWRNEEQKPPAHTHGPTGNCYLSPPVRVSEHTGCPLESSSISWSPMLVLEGFCNSAQRVHYASNEGSEV